MQTGFLLLSCSIYANAAGAGVRMRIHSTVSDPNIAFLVVLVGMLGIYCEFLRPGLVIPGVVGGVALLLGASAIAAQPVNHYGVALMPAAVVLFVLDARYGWRRGLGAGAAIAMALAAGLLIDGPVGIRWPIAILGSAGLAAVTVYLNSVAARARRNKMAGVGLARISGA